MTVPDWFRQVEQAEQLFDQKQLDPAQSLAEQALRLNPNCARALQVLGLVHLECDRPREAMPMLRTALTWQTDLVAAHNGLGQCYSLLGDLDQALQQYDIALRLKPDHPSAHFNRALAWLKQGRYREGWVEYEWRWPCGLLSRPQIPRPRWDGTPLAGRGILIHTEQGLGDVLQFVRLFPLLQALGGRVVLVCQKALQTFLRQLPTVDSWFPVDEPGEINFEVYAPLLSLPGLLGIEERTIPRTVPYLFADRERVAHWQPRLQAIFGFKVGLCWQGSPTFKSDRLRSISLQEFAPLAEIPGVALVSLQKGAGVEQLEPNRRRLHLTAFDDLDQEAAFVDTAAIMQHLDLVITADTALAHLAGALGHRVWVLLSVGCDWRWSSTRADCPWYPTMRLFRQKSFGDWTAVFQEVAAALRREPAGEVTSSLGTDGAPGAGNFLRVPVSAGELLDKITILEIKQARIHGEDRLVNIRRELEGLRAVQHESLPASAALEELTTALKNVNECLWEIEDQLGLCERAGDFGERFIQLARSVYQTNDRRAALKRRINELLPSPIVEEKSYAGRDMQEG